MATPVAGMHVSVLTSPRTDHVSHARSADAVVGKTQGMGTMELCFLAQQELLLSAFFRMTVNRIGRDMDGPSSTPL